MNRKSLLLLFIISFLCVIYTINNICDKYVDNNICSMLASVNGIQCMQDLGENSKLAISLTTGCVFFCVFTFLPNLYVILMFFIFLILYLLLYKYGLKHDYAISLISPLLSIGAAKGFADAYYINFKENFKQKFERVLGKYISKSISDKIINNSEDVKLGGKRAEISVMFADIRGFTSLSETRKAEEVSKLLNEYFTELEPIIEKYNGVINKFIGDAILVVFGDPSPDSQHALKAVKCANEMRSRVKEIRERWITEGKPKIDIGIGINTGEAFIGNVGSSNRFEYTVIGDTVNIASRIEDYNKICKTNILISENTYNKISQIVDVIKIREVAIKGKRNKINIYEVLRITE